MGARCQSVIECFRRDDVFIYRGEDIGETCPNYLIPRWNFHGVPCSYGCNLDDVSPCSPQWFLAHLSGCHLWDDCYCTASEVSCEP